MRGTCTAVSAGHYVCHGGEPNEGATADPGATTTITETLTELLPGPFIGWGTERTDS